jgi:hypothetical protein
MIIVRRVKHRNQQASFNALTLAAAVGGAGYGTWYALNARNKEFRHKQRDFMKKNPLAQGVLMATSPAVAAGYYGGKVFSRRRRTKNGKTVVENVRRK